MPIPIEVGLDALLRGQKLFQSQNYEAAIESFDLAIRAGLADAHIFEMHATALQAKEWHLDAIEYFTKAIHLNDIDCNLYFMRADSKEAIWRQD
jgi:tetratricopeptide (TPR) repeat protein